MTTLPPKPAVFHVTLLSLTLALALAGCGDEAPSSGAGEGGTRGGTATCASICDKGKAKGCGADFDDVDCPSQCVETEQRSDEIGCGAEWDAYLACVKGALDTTCDPKTVCNQDEIAACAKQRCSADPPPDACSGGEGGGGA